MNPATWTDGLATMARDFHFLRPLWLLALPLLWGLVAWLARRRQRDGDWSALIDAELLDGLRLAGDGAPAGGRPPSPWPWLALAWTLAVLALAGPSWARDAAPAYRAPATWVVVLDLSPSMAAADVAPSRATRARYAIDDLLSAAHDARVGLIAFGDEAYTVAPVTDDVATVRALLPPLAPDLLPTAGDHLAPALEQAGQLLARSGAPHGHVIVLSDGFNDPAAALKAAATLQASGATVDVVAIGTAAGAPVPNPAGGFEATPQGTPALARLDTELLQRLSAAGGGREVALAQLPSLIDALDTRPALTEGGPGAPQSTVTHWRDGGAWLLLPLLPLVALLARRGWL